LDLNGSCLKAQIKTMKAAEPHLSQAEIGRRPAPFGGSESASTKVGDGETAANGTFSDVLIRIEKV
jgi:hypothetical protein